MANLDIAKEFIEEALYNLANLDLFFQDAQEAFSQLSEERQKDLLFLVDRKFGELPVITNLENLGEQLSRFTASMFNEATIIMESIYKNHLKEEEKPYFEFSQKSEEMLRDALESKK